MEQNTPSPLQQLLGRRRLVLGSGSPRRHALVAGLGLSYEVRVPECDEIYPATLPLPQVPLYLAQLKADTLRPSLQPDEVLLTADTVVLIGDRLIGKPANLDEARATLHTLSGQWHQVITGYCLATSERLLTGEALSSIRFAPLTEAEISYYLDHYEVLDKAGAYAVQEWIGLIGVEEIRGSYNNIMGLPTTLIYRDLKRFLTE